MMVSDRAQRRVSDFQQRCGEYGEVALHLAYHAALPVALNAELLHLLRINFFLDPPEVLPFTVEFEFLLSSLCREIDAGLYEIEPDIRDVLLAGLTQTYGTDRTRDIATLLWQYVDHHSPWGDRVELERAQQLTALNFLNPEKAQEWLATVETEVSQGQMAAREWYVVMRQEIENQTQLCQEAEALQYTSDNIEQSNAELLKQISQTDNLPDLLQALQHPSSIVRKRAATALGRVGGDVAIAALIAALNDEDSSVRKNAAGSLGHIGNDRAVTALIAALNDENSSVRKNAAQSLGHMGNDRAVDALIASLNDDTNFVRKSAAEALGRIGSDRAVDALITTLNDEDGDVRRITAASLGQIGSSRAVVALITALNNDEASSVRWSATAALGQIGGDQAVDALIAALNHWDRDVRRSAAAALGQINSDKVTNALITALCDADSYVQWSAAEVLAEAGNAIAIDALVALLTHEDNHIRWRATELLGQLGTDQAIAALIDALNHTDGYVKRNAAVALGQIGTDQAIAALITGLDHPDSAVRRNVAEVLGRMGDDRGVTALITALNDGNSSVRWSAAEGLGRIGDDKAVHALIPLLHDGDSHLRAIAATALGQIGSNEAVPALINALQDQNSLVRSQAAKALEKFSPASKAAILGINVIEAFAPEIPVASLKSLANSQEWIMSGNMMRLGRKPDNDLKLPEEPGISRQHAEISRRYSDDHGTQPTYFLRDISRYGSWILTPETEEWQKVHQEEVILSTGTQLKFGSTQNSIYEFSIKHPEDSPSPLSFAEDLDFASTPESEDSFSQRDSIRLIPIEELQLSESTYNSLKKLQIHSISDLLNFTQEDLLKMINLANGKEVIQALQAQLGITLPNELKEGTDLSSPEGIPLGNTGEVASLLNVQALEDQQDPHAVQESFEAYLLENNVDPHAIEWLRLYLQGYSQEAIAAALQLSVRQVYRLREKITYHATKIFAPQTQSDLVLSWFSGEDNH